MTNPITADLTNNHLDSTITITLNTSQVYTLLAGLGAEVVQCQENNWPNLAQEARDLQAALRPLHAAGHKVRMAS